MSHNIDEFKNTATARNSASNNGFFEVNVFDGWAWSLRGSHFANVDFMAKIFTAVISSITV